jgi:hypothetical protein
VVGEARETASVVGLLTDGARLTMPLLPLEYTGRAAFYSDPSLVGRFGLPREISWGPR